MHAMRSIGVELVTMFESSKLEPSRIRELTTLLTKHAEAMPQQFTHAPNPVRARASAAKAIIWTKPDDFQAAASTFQQKAKLLKRVVDISPDSKLENILPALVDAGNSCVACHQQFRIGGDPPHD
jgi:cytochrome c556